MNSAAPSIQAAAYQLILNRRIGKYKLPKNVVVIAAGNREWHARRIEQFFFLTVAHESLSGARVFAPNSITG
jgi:undecaprenyl pyrophosphate synthase